jgi:hypothetical protein
MARGYGVGLGVGVGHRPSFNGVKFVGSLDQFIGVAERLSMSVRSLDPFVASSPPNDGKSKIVSMKLRIAPWLIGLLEIYPFSFT